ncbi:MAG: hypothetical protein US49_C0001G0212 [candidate division TM6 bacterium GW2011_GWF2_37_49]|nr:MAG: hypothetical protein US49_C0001G0212 [candidate division TM6 bacterium GW2011_GWF2_37_49]
MRFTKIIPLLAAVLLCQSAQPVTEVMSSQMKKLFLLNIKNITSCSDKDIKLMARSVTTGDFTELKKSVSAIILALNRIRGWKLPKDTPEYVEEPSSSASTPAVNLPDGFFEAVNAAFLKIDVLAMPSHVTDAYLITPMQAKYLKIKVAEDLYKLYTEKKRGWVIFWRKYPQSTTYQDKLVTKIVLNELKPIIEPKLRRMKRGNKQNLYDAETLYNFRLKAISDPDIYSKYPMWFDGYINYVGRYQALTRILVEPEVPLELDTHHNPTKDRLQYLENQLSKMDLTGDIGSVVDDVYKLDFIAKPERGTEDAIAMVKQSIRDVLSRRGGFTTEELAKKSNKKQATINIAKEILDVNKQFFRSKYYMADLKPGDAGGTKSAPEIDQSTLVNLKSLRTLSAELYTVGIGDLASKELSSARWRVAGGVMMKMLVIAVVLPIIYVAVMPGAVTAVSTYLSSLTAQYPAIAALVAKIQAVEYAAYFARFKNSAFVVALTKFAQTNSTAFLEMLNNSAFIKYFTNIDSTMITLYLAKIVENPTYLKFMSGASWGADKAKDIIAGFVSTIRSANLGEVFVKLFTQAGGMIPESVKAWYGSVAGFVAGFVDGKAMPIATAVFAKGLSVLMLLWTALQASSLLGLIKGGASILGAFLLGEIISCWRQDPEHAKQYYIYYTLLELQMRVAELDLNIARHVDVAQKQGVEIVPVAANE